VERAQVLVDLAQRREPLDGARRRLQQRRPRLRRLAGNLHALARRRHRAARGRYLGGFVSRNVCLCASVQWRSGRHARARLHR
jgi:hypothetical protein